jgi:hypothetical protein
MRYAKAVFIGGVVIPLVLHLLAPSTMRWWPDTVSIAIAFGVAAVLIANQYQKDRIMRKRLSRAIKDIVKG